MRFRLAFHLLATILVTATLAIAVSALALALDSDDPRPLQGDVMTFHARGTFNVTVSPQAADDAISDSRIGRLDLHKQFHGDMQGSARGLMLGVGSPASGSAGYVAMDLVTASMHGRQGSFALQHNGSMQPGSAPQMQVTVVPGSGGGDLAGISGILGIEIIEGQHHYDFAYLLPGAE